MVEASSLVKRAPLGARCLFSLLPSTSHATNLMYMPFETVLSQALRAGRLDGCVKFYLVGETLPKQVRKLYTVSSSRKTNGSNKSDEDACFWALQSALATLQNAAKKADANAVINIASVDQRDLYKDTEKFQCRAGLVVSSVALRGDLAHVD